MALLSLVDVTKSFAAGRPLLDGVSLVVGEEDRVGLIGPNGSGKSTLLALLAGRLEPDGGERTARRGLQVGYLEQEPRFPADATVRDIVRAGIEGRERLLADLDAANRALAAPGLAGDELERVLRRQQRLQARLDELGGHDVEHRVEATIDGVGLPDPDARCGRLSGGEARRVALARLLVAEPELLLLDEPTNHLDAFVVAWLEERLARLRAPLVLVTHDRYLLDRTVDRIVEVDRGKIFAYDGGYGRYLELRAERLEAEGRREAGRLALLRRETAWMRRGPPARTTKSKARQERFGALVAATLEGLPAELELALPPGPRLGSKVVELHGVEVELGGRPVLPRLDLELRPDMRLGVVGPNGAGKTTLLRVLLGRLAPTRGERIVGETVRFAAVDQGRDELDPAKTVAEEVAGPAQHVAVGERTVHVAGFLDAFLFPGQRKDALVGDLSGGERGRVLLAKLLLQGGNVLVLDEPTNDLDLATLRALEEALVVFPGAVVVVSHDRWFLDRVATHVLHLDGRGGAALHPGGATDLLERLVRERSSAASKEPAKPAATAAPKPGPAAAPRKKGLSNWERRELEELTERIATLEAEQAALDARLADPALYRGPADAVRTLQAEREASEAALTTAMSRWEALADRDG